MVLFSFNAFCQETTPKKWKFSFQLDNRFSSIRGNNITIFGAKAGIQYKNLTRFGIGGSFIINPVSFEYLNKKLNVMETSKISFWYLSLFNDWILYKSNHWECFVTEQIGTGKPELKREINNETVSDVNIGLFVNEISGQVDYKVTNWIGLGAGFGYRNILNNDERFKAVFNAPIYIVKVIVYPETFFR